MLVVVDVERPEPAGRNVGRQRDLVGLVAVELFALRVAGGYTYAAPLPSCGLAIAGDMPVA